jgi:hypothetical protein
MQKKTVYIVINPELGWDNVVGIFDPDHITREQLEAEFPEDDYELDERTVYTSVDMF